MFKRHLKERIRREKRNNTRNLPPYWKLDKAKCKENARRKREMVRKKKITTAHTLEHFQLHFRLKQNIYFFFFKQNKDLD